MMNPLEAARVAFGAVISNKLRTFLTALGVVIGVAAVIALVSVGEGASARITGQIQSLGSNLILVSPASGQVRLTLEDAARLEQRVPSLTRVAPSVSSSGTVKWMLNSYETTIEGVGPEHLTVREYKLASGRFLTESDVTLNRRVAVVGYDVVGDLFKGREPVGQELMVYGQQFTVVGVLQQKGESMGGNPDDIVFIPVTTAQRLLGSSRLSVIYAQLQDGSLATTTVAQIERIFEQSLGRSGQVRVQSQDELLEAVDTATRTLTLMLAAIAGISLLVGGIGIMNIMLVSVTERTREVGLRKAVGAGNRDVLSQFLAEALFISMSGGLVGIAVGVLLAKAIARFGSWNTSVSPASIGISFLFAAVVGVGFGLYPAMKAARLDPINALRYE